MPKDIQIFFPMAAMLGAILGLGILAHHNEILIMQASGFTRIQIAFSVIKTAIPLALLSMAIGEWIAPQGEQIAYNSRAKAMYGDSLISTQQGLWAKDSGNFIYIERVKSNSELWGVNVYSFNQDRHLQSILYAVSAKFDVYKKLWCLYQVNELNLQNLNQISSSETISAIWKTNLTPDKLDVAIISSDALSIKALYNYAQYLKFNGQDARSYQLNMWSKIFQPIFIVVMILLALSFIFGPLRNVTMRTRMITGIIFGLLFYLFSHIFGPLMLVYNISPIIGALLPNASFLLISLCLLLKSS